MWLNSVLFNGESVGSASRVPEFQASCLIPAPNLVALCSITYLHFCSRYKNCIDQTLCERWPRIESLAVSHPRTHKTPPARSSRRAAHPASRLPVGPRPPPRSHLCCRNSCCSHLADPLVSLFLDALPPLHLPYLVLIPKDRSPQASLLLLCLQGKALLLREVYVGGLQNPASVFLSNLFPSYYLPPPPGYPLVFLSGGTPGILNGTVSPCMELVVSCRRISIPDPRMLNASGSPHSIPPRFQGLLRNHKIPQTLHARLLLCFVPALPSVVSLSSSCPFWQNCCTFFEIGV